MDRSGRLARARRAAVTWGVFVFVLTSWPKPPRVPVLSGIPHFDKVVHFLLYGVEALLLYWSVRWPGRPIFSLGRVFVVVGAMAVWGIADEVHQTWIPGRVTEANDVAADIAGATVGAVLASLLGAGWGPPLK